MGETFTWASSIPLVSILVACFTAGVVVTKVNSMKQEIRDLKKDLLDRIKEVEDDALKHVSEIRRNLAEQISEVKKDLQRSSESQGSRLGELEAVVREAKKEAQVRLEMTGRHSIPQEIK
jgi:gas vesicle protein